MRTSAILLDYDALPPLKPEERGSNLVLACTVLEFSSLASETFLDFYSNLNILQGMTM